MTKEVKRATKETKAAARMEKEVSNVVLLHLKCCGPAKIIHSFHFHYRWKGWQRRKG
jgi:hypothetical protein